jgi:hypothetical protein
MTIFGSAAVLRHRDMDPPSVIVCRSNADCVIAAAEGVAVAFWLCHTNVEDVEELARAVRRAQRGSTQRVKLVQIVPQTATTPDAPARAALARMLRGLQGIVSHSVIVFEGEGFRAAMVRSIVTSIASLSNPGFPHRVFARLPEAAAWMCGGSAALGARQIEAVVQHIRTAIVRVGAAARGDDDRSAVTH